METVFTKKKNIHRMYKRDGQLYFIRIKGNWVVHGVCNCYTNEQVYYNLFQNILQPKINKK